MLRETRKKYIISAASLLFLFVATASGFFLVKRSQDNRQQASGVCQPGDPYCSCDFWGSNCVLVDPDGSRTIVEQGSEANNNGVLSTSYTGDRPTTADACGGIWMSDFCYMPGDEIAGGYVVVESGRYNYPYFEKKEVYESPNYGAETVSNRLGSTDSLGPGCGGKGLAINDICYAYGSTINGYLVMPARTSDCNNSTGDYCYAHLEKIDTQYDDWQAAVTAYETNGDVSQLEALYKATYGIDFDSTYLYDSNAPNADILKAQALVSALTNASILQADAAAQNALLEEKGNLTPEEQALYDYNQKLINDPLLENRLSTVDQLTASVSQQTTVNKAVQEMYQELVTAGSGDVETVARNKFKEIFGYDPTGKYGGLDAVLTVFGIDPNQLDQDRKNYADWIEQQEQAVLAEQLAQAQVADAEQLANQQRSDTISQAISDYAGGASSERDFKQIAVSSGFISQQQADLMTIDEILAYIYQSNPSVSAEQAQEFADSIASSRSNVIQEQSLLTSYQNDPTNKGALEGLYELYTGHKTPYRMTNEELVSALAQQNPQFALQAYLDTGNISYLKNSYAQTNNLIANGTVLVNLPDDEEVLLQGMFNSEIGSQIYNQTVLPGLVNSALDGFAENPDELEDVCSKALGRACNITTENASIQLGAMFDVIYAGRDDINTSELAISYSNQLLADSQEEKKESFWEMAAANIAMAFSGDSLAIASLTSDTAAEAFEANLEYQSEAMANYSLAVDTAQIFDAQDTFEYAVMVKPDLSDYTFGTAMGNAFMYDNVFGGEYNNREDLGLSTWDSIGMGWNQIETQFFGVTGNVENIATNYSVAMSQNYTGPANTYVADIAMQAGSNLQFADVNNPGSYVTAVDNYTAANNGYYAGQAATNVGSAIADWAVTAGTYIALSNQNASPSYYGANVGQDILTLQEIKDTATAAGDEVRADIQNNFYTNQATKYVDQSQLTGISDTTIQQAMVADQVQNFVDFQTDEEIVRSRQELNWETVEKVVAPTAAIVALPIAIASGAGIGVVAGVASSAFSLYQGAGMKAQALDTQTQAVGRYGYEDRVNIAAQDLVNNPIIDEKTGKTITYTYDEAVELIASQEEMLNKQANMMLASSAVGALTSGAGIINGFAQAAGVSSGFAVSTANAMGVAGRLGGIGLSSANAYNSAQTLFDENASAGEKWMSGLSTFVAASGVVGNSFGFINNPTGATQAITTRTDLILDIMNVPAGVAIDMQQVSKACYDDDYPGDETACRDAWIGLALSLTQDIAQTTSSVNAYRQYQADDAIQKINSVDSEINKILANQNRTIGENLDLGELQLRRDALIASALAINPDLKIPDAPVTTLLKTNVAEIRTEDLMQTAAENRSTLLSRASEVEESNPTLAAQLRQQADGIFNRQFEISSLGDEIRAIDEAIDQNFDKLSLDKVEELRERRNNLVSELDDKVNDPAYQAHNLTTDNKQLTIALKENEVFKAYDEFKAAEQEQIRLEQQNIPPPIDDLTKQTGLATLLPKVAEQNKALDLVVARDTVAEIQRLSSEKADLNRAVETEDNLLRIEEIDRQLADANTELNKIIETADKQSIWQRVKNILPGSKTEKTYNEAILALKDVNQFNQDNIRLEELSDKHLSGTLTSDERQEYNRLLDDLEGADQRYNQSQQKVNQAVLGVADSLQNSKNSFGAIAFVNKATEGIKNFFSPSEEVKTQRRFQGELETSKNDLDLLGKHEKLTADLNDYRLELVKSEEALANATDSQRAALESDIGKYNDLIGDAEKQIADIEKNIDVSQARDKYFQGIIDSESQRVLEASFDEADLTAFRHEVENLKNAGLDKLDLGDAERALIDQIITNKNIINSKNTDAITNARTEYAEALSELSQRILGDNPDVKAYQRLGEVQNVIKANDLLGSVSKISQIRDVLASTEIKLNTDDPLVAAQMATIIRDIEFRTGATEGVQFFNARTNQVDTMLKILNGERVAVELTTAGGKTFVGAAVLKTQTEVMGYETGIYIAKPGQETAVQSAMAIAYGVDVNKIPILDNSRLSDPDYVNSLKDAAFIIADPAQVQFIRNTALNVSDPNFRTAVEVYSKLTNDVALYVDELQITLDPSRQAINSVGPSTADISQTYKDTASLIGQALDQTVLKNGGWGLGDNDFLVLKTQDGADIAKFSKDAQGQIFSKLADEMGISSNKYGTIAENAAEVEKALGQGEDVLLAKLSELGVDGVDTQKATQILDQIDMLNSFAQGLKMQKGTDYIRAVDAVLAKNGGPDRNVTIPAAGGVSNEGQSYKANLQAAMEYIGARAYGDSVDFAGLKSSPNEAFRSNISSYFASLKNSAVGAVTGAMADGAGVAEVSLGLTTYRSTEAVDKIVGIEGVASGGRIFAERAYAVIRDEVFKAVVSLKNSGKLDTSDGKASNGNLKIVMGTDGAEDPLNFAINLAKDAAFKDSEFAVQNADGSYSKITIENGKVVSEDAITTKQIQDLYDNGAENLVTIIGRGGATGDSIKTAGNIPGITVTSQRAPVGLVAQAGSRIDRGGDIADQYALIITPGSSRVDVDKPMSVAEFSQFKNGVIENQKIVEQAKNTQALDQGVVTASNRVLETLVLDSGNEKIRQWASDLLLKFSTESSQRDLDLDGGSQSSLASRQGKIEAEVNKWKEVLADPANASILRQISTNNPEVYKTILTNAGVDATRLSYARSVDTDITKESVITADNLDDFIRRHNIFVAKDSESEFVASSGKQVQTEQIATKNQQNSNDAIRVEANVTAVKKTVRDLAEVVSNPIKIATELGTGGVVVEVLKAPGRVIDYAKNLDVIQKNSINNYRAQRESLSKLRTDLAAEKDANLKADLQQQIDNLETEIAAVPFLTKASSFVDANITGGVVRERVASWFNSEEAIPGLNDSKKAVVNAIGGASWWNQRGLRSVATTEDLYTKVKDQFSSLNTRRPAINNEEQFNENLDLLAERVAEIKDLQDKSGLEFIEFDKQGRPVLDVDGNFIRVNEDLYKDLSSFRTKAGSEIDKLAKAETDVNENVKTVDEKTGAEESDSAQQDSNATTDQTVATLEAEETFWNNFLDDQKQAMTEEESDEVDNLWINPDEALLNKQQLVAEYFVDLGFSKEDFKVLLEEEYAKLDEPGFENNFAAVLGLATTDENADEVQVADAETTNQQDNLTSIDKFLQRIADFKDEKVFPSLEAIRDRMEAFFEDQKSKTPDRKIAVIDFFKNLGSKGQVAKQFLPKTLKWTKGSFNRLVTVLEVQKNNAQGWLSERRAKSQEQAVERQALKYSGVSVNEIISNFNDEKILPLINKVGHSFENVKSRISFQFVPRTWKRLLTQIEKASIKLPSSKNKDSFRKMSDVYSAEIIGRKQENGYLNDNFVSRDHAILYRNINTEVLAIADNNSSNGTFVNGKLINGATLLSENDQVRLGSRLILEVKKINGKFELVSSNGRVIQGKIQENSAEQTVLETSAYINLMGNSSVKSNDEQIDKGSIKTTIRLRGSGIEGWTDQQFVDFIYSKDLGPKHKVIVDGVEYLLSDPYTLPGGRLATIAYIKSGNTYTARSFYRSNSSSSWRMLPNYFMTDGRVSWYGKAFSEDSINAPVLVQKGLAAILGKINSKNISEDDAATIFRGLSKHAVVRDDLNDSFIFEINQYPEALAINNNTLLGRRLPDPSRITFQNNEDKPNFASLIDFWDEDTSVYGTIRKEVYVSHNEKYRYVFYRDTQGRAGIISVELTSARITSQGVRESYVNFHGLNVPILEYEKQSDGYGGKPSGYGSYVDMYENYLSKVPLIKEYQRVIKERLSSKNFQNSCSSCAEVREQTKTGLLETDRLWEEAQTQYAAENTAEADSLKEQALAQIKKTREEVVNDHGMENQCVQMYLNAWADTREAEIRQTRVAIDRAIDSVYDATLEAEKVLKTGQLELLERKGFLGIAKKTTSIDIVEEDLLEVRGMLEGDENFFGLQEMINFGRDKNGDLDKTVIIGGSLFENDSELKENSIPLTSLLDTQQEEINNLVANNNSLTEKELENYLSDLNSKNEKVRSNSYSSVSQSEIEKLISGLEEEINQEINSVSNSQLPSSIDDYDSLDYKFSVAFDSFLIRNQGKINFISSLPSWLQRFLGYDLEVSNETDFDEFFSQQLAADIDSIKDSLNQPINNYQDLEEIGLKIEALINKSSELVDQGLLSDSDFSDLLLKEAIKNKDDSSLSTLLRVRILKGINVLMETYMSLAANYGETVLSRVTQKQKSIEALSMANISVAAEHNQSARESDPALPYLNGRENLDSLRGRLADLYQLDLDGHSGFNIYQARRDGLEQPALNSNYEFSVSGNVIYLLAAYDDPIEAKNEIKAYIKALMNNEDTSRWDSLIKDGANKQQRQYYDYRSFFNSQENNYDYGLENLALVHLTDFEPNIEDGYLSISNTNESAGAFRTSLHFSVQSPVHDVSAMGKLTSWKDKGIAFIIPFQEAIEVNGSPVNVLWQDTFWGLGMNERFILPVGTVVLLRPNNPREEEIRQIDGINVVIVDESRTVWEQVYFAMQDMGFKPDLMQYPTIGDSKDLASDLSATNQLHMALMGGLYEQAERGFDNSLLAMNTDEEKYLEYIDIVNGERDGDVDRAVGSLIRMGHFTYGGDLGFELYPHIREGRFEFNYGDYPLPNSDVTTYDYNPYSPEGLYDRLSERVGADNLHLTPRYEAVVKFNIMKSPLWRYPWFVDMVLSNFSMNSTNYDGLKDLLGITSEELDFIINTKTQTVPELNKVFKK